MASSCFASPRPLAGIVVLDVGTLTPGKFSTLLLADLGASVVRVERPLAGTNALTDEDLMLNRNKRSIALNLREPAAREIFYTLVEQADVVLEGHRPGVAHQNLKRAL
jgi:alpha-methylacyl-CoA racemase